MAVWKIHNPAITFCTCTFAIVEYREESQQLYLEFESGQGTRNALLFSGTREIRCSTRSIHTGYDDDDIHPEWTPGMMAHMPVSNSTKWMEEFFQSNKLEPIQGICHFAVPLSDQVLDVLAEKCELVPPRSQKYKRD